MENGRGSKWKIKEKREKKLRPQNATSIKKFKF